MIKNCERNSLVTKQQEVLKYCVNIELDHLHLCNFFTFSVVAWSKYEYSLLHHPQNGKA